MSTLDKIVNYITIGCSIIIVFVCISLINKNKKYEKQITELTNQIEYYKQAANPSKEKIDSLQDNIQHRDSIIYDIKTKYIKDVEIIKNMPDSNTVNLFKELVWAE